MNTLTWVALSFAAWLVAAVVVVAGLVAVKRIYVWRHRRAQARRSVREYAHFQRVPHDAGSLRSGEAIVWFVIGACALLALLCGFGLAVFG